MHYAEFAEDEVRPMQIPYCHCAVMIKLTEYTTERSLIGGYQRVRGEQMEGDWPESGQTGKGRIPSPGAVWCNLPCSLVLTDPTGVRAVCEGTFRRQSIDSRRSIVS